MSLQSEIMRQYLQSIRGQTQDEAKALPGAFYTDHDWVSLEQDELFTRHWICCGRTEEIPEVGDYITFEIAEEPLLIIRGDDGNPQALANICRHRGTTLVAETRGHTRRLVCPYHHWSYDTNGKLLFAPGIGESAKFQPDECHLPTFPVAEWMGFLFVNLSANPPELAPLLAPLTRRIQNYHLEEMRLRYVEHETWDTNWKCLFENFMEGYHLSPLHRSTLHKVNPSRLCRHFPPGEHFLGYTVGFTSRVDETQAGHPDLDADERNTCVMFAVPPGLVVGIGSDYSSFLSLQPDGAERVRVKMGLYFFGDDWSTSSIDEAVQLFKDTMSEDKSVLLRLQKGLRSRHYQPGPLAPEDLEGTCHDLHQFIARHMASPAGHSNP